MFANVQIDDHYCPDNADNAHVGIRKRRETSLGISRHCLNFQFQCINCPWFVAINAVF